MRMGDGGPIAMYDDDDDGGLQWFQEVGQYEQDQHLQSLRNKEMNNEIRESREKESQATAGTDRTVRQR